MDTITKIDLNSAPTPVNESKKVTPTHVSLAQGNVQPMKSKLMLPVVLLAIVAGLAAGFVYAKKHLLIAGSGSGTTVIEDTSKIKVGTVVGAQDESIFKASAPAEGILQPGGTGGEGSHHIVRGDNQSQWVYITSSVIDLDQFVGDKVTVWGETIQGKKAGWLMDVGRLKVTELNAAEVDEIKATEN